MILDDHLLYLDNLDDHLLYLDDHLLYLGDHLLYLEAGLAGQEHVVDGVP